MSTAPLAIPCEAQTGLVPVWHAQVDAASLLARCGETQAAGGRLVSLWGSDERALGAGFSLHVALATAQGLFCLHLALPAEAPSYPDLSSIFFSANRLQRASHDLLGISAQGGDTRPWLRHANWPADFFPLRTDSDASRSFPTAAERYDFVRVEGVGVHEIPVGPIHAGIIEPGQFRFSVIGERVLRLEQRLGWKHKGIDKRFESLCLADGARLAGRVSGDSTVAYAWAYCQALESMAGAIVPPRAAWLRALLLERERVANHLGDLGYLGNDAALAFALTQFMCLREDWLRMSNEYFGHRLMMDSIVPGGVAFDIDDDRRLALHAQCKVVEGVLKRLRRIFEEHAGLQDRFMNTGCLSPSLARRLGVTGLVGRASGLAHDLRCDFPFPPYDEIEPCIATREGGDVAARVEVRIEEILESLRIIRHIADHTPAGDIATAVGPVAAGASALGWVEGWRGEVLVALTAGANGGIRRCFCHDPSWNNWPALEHAIMGNIVPDFPLINKSFNLSYSGPDL